VLRESFNLPGADDKSQAIWHRSSFDVNDGLKRRELSYRGVELSMRIVTYSKFAVASNAILRNQSKNGAIHRLNRTSPNTSSAGYAMVHSTRTRLIAQVSTPPLSRYHLWVNRAVSGIAKTI